MSNSYLESPQGDGTYIGNKQTKQKIHLQLYDFKRCNLEVS